MLKMKNDATRCIPHCDTNILVRLINNFKSLFGTNKVINQLSIFNQHATFFNKFVTIFATIHSKLDKHKNSSDNYKNDKSTHNQLEIKMLVNEGCAFLFYYILWRKVQREKAKG